MKNIFVENVLWMEIFRVELLSGWNGFCEAVETKSHILSSDGTIQGVLSVIGTESNRMERNGMKSV